MCMYIGSTDATALLAIFILYIYLVCISSSRLCISWSVVFSENNCKFNCVIHCAYWPGQEVNCMFFFTIIINISL